MNAMTTFVIKTAVTLLAPMFVVVKQDTHFPHHILAQTLMNVTQMLTIVM